jgi:hypothetical protein
MNRPWSNLKTRLKSTLPLVGEDWQAQAFRIGDEDDPFWFTWVTNNDLGLMIKYRVSDDKPSAEFLWDVLVDAMQHPDTGDPGRPERILAERNQGWEDLKEHLRDIEVRLALRKHLTLEDGVPETMDEAYRTRKERRKTKD